MTELWSVRIPAAIARAKAVLTPEGSTSGKLLKGMSTLTKKGIVANLTATEVALAEALYLAEIRIDSEWGMEKESLPDPALREFTEKVEASQC